MYPNLSCPTCGAASCSVHNLPAASTSACVQIWTRRKSEFKRVFLAPYDGTNTAPIDDANMETLLSWTSLIDNATTTAPYIRELYVVGDLPAPEKDIFNYKDIEIVNSKTYTANFDQIDVNDTNYSFSREMDCGGQYWMAWETDGGSMYGWALATLDSDIILNRGNESLETLVYTAKFTADCKPPRYDSVFAT